MCSMKLVVNIIDLSKWKLIFVTTLTIKELYCIVIFVDKGVHQMIQGYLSAVLIIAVKLFTKVLCDERLCKLNA